MIEQALLEQLLEACLVPESVHPSEPHCLLVEPVRPELPEQEPDWEPVAVAPASSFFLEWEYPNVLRQGPLVGPVPVLMLRWWLEHRRQPW